MKKNGFTLAEVLITLAIIGVVATLTLPSLMSNTQEQQAVTAFRKAMNTLNEVAQMNAAVHGFDFSGITTTTQPTNRNVFSAQGILEQSIWGIMKANAQVDQTRSGLANAAGIGPGGECDNVENVVAFRDGTTLCYAATATAANADTVINGVIDTNGLKAPNTLSTCGNATCTQAKNIKDQFVITLHGSVAIPGRVTHTVQGGYVEAGVAAQNNAARWAMSK